MPRARSREASVVDGTPSSSGPTRAIDLPAAALERGNEVGALARPSLRLGLNRHGCLRRLEDVLGRCPRRHFRAPRSGSGITASIASRTPRARIAARS